MATIIGQSGAKVVAPDEINLQIRFSQAANYLEITERDNKPIHSLTGLNVMLALALNFLEQEFQQRSMLVGQGGTGGTKKNDDKADVT